METPRGKGEFTHKASVFWWPTGTVLLKTEFDGEVRLFDQSGSGLTPVIPALYNQLEFVLRGQVGIYFSILDVLQGHA